MNKAEIPFLTALELGELIRKRAVSPVEATEAYLERIDAVDHKLNSYITVCYDEALQAARSAEEAISRGEYHGLLHGVPVAVKDQFWTKGIRTTAGSTILRDFVPGEDATVIAKLKESGAVILGKLNMSEFASGNTVVHPFGTPHNPWDLERIPGPSSSGPGAATAAFLCATSLGEDTGGSIRSPATFCGLVGLRPTWGRVSRHGMLGATWSMDTAGPISRTVEDCAITLHAIAGYDPKDPYTANIAVPDYRADLDGKVRGIRIGLVKEGMNPELLEPEVRRLVSKAVAHLGEMGASIEEVSIPLLPYSSGIGMGVESASLHLDWLRTRLGDLEHNTATGWLAGAIMPAQFYYQAQKLRELIRRQVFEALNQVDVLALPSSSHPATLIPKGSDSLNSKQEARQRIGGRRTLNGAFALASVPAMTVPCGFISTNGKDLPIGLQLAGRPFTEGLLMKVAHAYEQSTEWHTRRPPI